MQQMHDQAGGTAPNLDFQSTNGLNERYAPADRRPPKTPDDIAAEIASSSGKRPPGDPGAGKVKAKKNEFIAVPGPIHQAVQGHREAIPIPNKT